MIIVNVLGPLMITSDGHTFRGSRTPKKGRALLAYLALAGHPVSRERLADLLWPYQAQNQARHSLRNCLLEVRKRLGPARAALGSSFETCWLEAETDLQHLQRLAEGGRLGELQEATRLIRGELLDGLEITSEPWLEWLGRERDRVAGILGPLLTKYSELASAAGLHDEAIAAAHRLIRLNNLNEDAHRRLMQILAAAGQRSVALQQFKDLAKLLKEELGVTPDAVSVALRDEIRRDSGSEVEDEDERPTSAPVAPPPALRPVRVVSADLTSDDPLTVRLERLVAEIRSWKSGIARLTRPLIDETEKAMAAAALDRRRLAEYLQTLGDPPRMSEPVAA